MKLHAPLSFVVPHAVRPLSERNALLQRAFDAALEFAPDRPYNPPGEAPSRMWRQAYADWLIDTLLHDLKKNFWRDLYVHRPILSDILSTKSKGRVTIREV